MLKWLDRLALAGIVLSLVVAVLPGWTPALKLGFWGALGFTLLHIVTSHLVAPKGADA